MSDPRRLALQWSLLFLLVSGCQRSETPGAAPEAKGTDPQASATADVKVDGSVFHLRGPLTHENLTVFLLCSDQQDARDFLTLEEGLKEGVVKITEQEQERVGALQIENNSARPLFLQEGERLQGGKQDRTILTSLVIPPQSGQMSVPTLCVEKSRWVEGDKGRSFGFTVNPALAPKGVRGSAKIEGSQSGVWGCVAAQKVSGQSRLMTGNTNSSVNELLDAPQVRELSDKYAQALKGALDDAGEYQALGVVIVVNGDIEEVNVYPNHALFGKMYPRLIHSYALQATLLKELPSAPKPATAETVARFLAAGGEKSKQEKKLDASNLVRIRELEDARYQCETCYCGKVVHWQMLKKNGQDKEDGQDKDKARRGRILGAKW